MKTVNSRSVIEGNEIPLLLGAIALGAAIGLIAFKSRKKATAESKGATIFSLNGASEAAARRAIRGVGVATWT